MGQDPVLFLVKCCECSLPETDAFSPAGYIDRKASDDIAIVFLHKLVDRHHIGAVLCVVKFFAAAADIRYQQAVATKGAGGITEYANADASL